MTKVAELPVDTPQQRIAKAIQYAVSFGGVDGAHHKDWVIDQMVRALTGCPVETVTALNYRKEAYPYTRQGESAEYVEVVRNACAGEDGPNTYTWETGIAP